jgi:scyllo-inositol 2-dehydrogenase (NADP+)
MMPHPPFSALFVIEDDCSLPKSFMVYLQSMRHLKCLVARQLPADLSNFDVVVTRNLQNDGAEAENLGRFVENGGGWLILVHLSEMPLPAIFGVQPEPVGPAAELRILFETKNHSLAARLPDALYLPGRYQALRRIDDASETILYADWHYQHRPVLTHRLVGKGQAACTTLQAYENPIFQQILYRLMRRLAGFIEQNRELGVGLLGYSPAVGQSHGLGVRHTTGLSLRAVCDLNPQRLSRARQDFPQVKTYETSEAFSGDQEVNVVIVTTPPDTHAGICLQMMEAGKHVVCEKPLALTRKEANRLVEMADKQHVHLSCHQNRRWDPDFLAIKQAVAEGLIGDLFYLETFVGGFGHPCGYWHSHTAVCGGTSYDWGAHYLDWVVSLIQDPVESVVGTRHKRVWHDVTNADQERIQIRFSGGQEAEFMHSDVAAVRKPKWYLLGTEGAIVGHWQDVCAFEIDPIRYFHRHDIPATEMPPDLTLYRRHHTGQILSQRIAMPVREHYPFHRNLADHLLTGEPIEAPLKDSVKVVAILETAAQSMSKGGTLEVLRDG